MCRGADGAWREAGAPAKPLNAKQRAATPTFAVAAQNALPSRARLSYLGTYDVKLTKPMRIPSRLSLGNLLDAAGKMGGRTLTGAIAFKAVFEGPVVRMDVETSGGDTGRFRLSGAMTDGRCVLQPPGGKLTYEGTCGPGGFAGRITGQGNRGETVKGQFEAKLDGEIVDVVLAEQRAAEQRQLAIAEQKRKEQAARAAIEAMPRASAALGAQLAGYVTTDSRGWAFNRYDMGSMKNVRIASGSAKAGTMILRGEYTYNGGQSGWVLANMVRGKLDCIQFWDAMVGCRTLRTAAQGQAMRSTAFDLFFGGSGGGSGGGSSSGADQHADADRGFQRQMAIMNAPPPPPPPPLPSPLGW